MKTITEALAELKLIEKKIASKQSVILTNLTRYEHVKDPFESEGGAKKYIEAEIQSVADLRVRYMKIRGLIAKSNVETTLTINDITRTITEWLAWKRELAKGESDFISEIYSRNKNAMDSAASKPQLIPKDVANEAKLAVVISNIDQVKTLKSVENINDVKEKLDGMLSLKNATITINI